MADPILITGARGRIGRTIAARWQSRGCTLLDREEGDLTRYEAIWTDRFAGMVTIVHLAADPDPEASMDQAGHGNILAMLNILRASSHHRVQRVVFASSLWADYASWRLASKMTWYAASKIAGEALLHAWSAEQARPSVALRFGYFDPKVTSASPELEQVRLDEATLIQQMDDALEWSQPSCSVRDAVGRSASPRR